MGEYIELVTVDGRPAVRCKCGYDLGEAGKNWKEQTATLRLEADAAGPRRKLHKDLEMVAFLCPECGAMLSVDIKKKDEPLLFDAELKPGLLQELNKVK
ncbi:MAG: hypothetical protein JRJ85_15365, partial [Deltaproteobacteria bacterium]|nr:hypothetical protein [Deltaproteobacteria bacterium]